MSICRFGPGSSVYVFYNTGGKIECCSCILLRGFECLNESEMITHLEQHVAAGHEVPQQAFAALRDGSGRPDSWMREQKANKGASVVKMLLTADPDQRIVILQRKDGHFTFAHEHVHRRYMKPRPKGARQHVWVRGEPNADIYSTAKIAERHARERFPALFNL